MAVRQVCLRFMGSCGLPRQEFPVRSRLRGLRRDAFPFWFPGFPSVLRGRGIHAGRFPSGFLDSRLLEIPFHPVGFLPLQA